MKRITALQALLLFFQISFSQQPSLVLPIGHTGIIRYVQFSPDGKKIISAADDKTVKVWDVLTGTLLLNIPESDRAAFSPDGATFLTGSLTGITRLWNANTGAVIAELKEQKRNIIAMGYSPDGKRAFTTSYDKSVLIWNSNDGKLIYRLQGENAAYTPDNGKIITAGDSIVRIYNALNGTQIFVFKENISNVSSIQISSDSKAVTVSSYRTTKVWDILNGKLIFDLDDAEITCFNPKGNKIITTKRWDKTARILDLTSGSETAQIAGHILSIKTIEFSKNGDKILTTAKYGLTAKIWDSKTGALLNELKDRYDINGAIFSPNDESVVTFSNDYAIRVWNSLTGALKFEFKNQTDPVIYSPDGMQILTASSSLKLFDAFTGKPLKDFKGYTDRFVFAALTPNRKAIVTSNGNVARIWNAENGSLVTSVQLNNYQFSPDRKKYIVPAWSREANYDIHTSAHGYTVKSSRSKEPTAEICDAVTGNLLLVITGHKGTITSAEYSSDGKKIITAATDNSAKIWNAETGELLLTLNARTNGFAFRFNRYYFKDRMEGYQQSFRDAQFSPDDKKIITVSRNHTASVWNAYTGKKLFTLKGHTSGHGVILFSPDGKVIVSASHGNKIKIWDAATGELLKVLQGHTNKVISLQFDAGGGKLLSASRDGTVKVWNTITGIKMLDIYAGAGEVSSAQFRPDGKEIVTISEDGYMKIWNVDSAALMHTISVQNIKYYMPQIMHLRYGRYSSDGKYILGSYMQNEIGIWNATSGELVSDICMVDRWNGPVTVYKTDEKIYNPTLTRGADTLSVTIASDHTAKIFNPKTNELKYTLLALHNADYLTVDNEGRYDGTDGARKLLYLTCGLDVIKLDQIKDLCWEPGLVSKIMGVNKEPISAKRLKDISVCNNAPVIQNEADTADMKRFIIKERAGGIGEVAIYINQKEVETIPVRSLHFIHGEAELMLNLRKYQKFFEAGKENSVQLQVRTADLSVSTKGSELVVKDEQKASESPDLYAVIAGVSKYNGAELNLKFAAKDALDFSNALGLSAKKLLNTDGKEHVHISTLVSDGDIPPTKDNIRLAFEDIRSKAKPNDIVIIYISGHGEKFGTETSNFYYLTSNAVSFKLDGVEKDVAISTNEFADWLRLIPARKQIFILDACASGKLAEDMMFAVRDAVPSDQIKALDRLNSRTGTFILSGAAANQSAYETSKYGQGLLTYSLLYGIKSGEALREDVYIDVDKLFQYSADKVRELAMGIGGIQDPVISKPAGGASFDIGKCDSSVSSHIQLALPKPVFTNSRFTNAETGEDNLGLEKEVDKELNGYSSKGKESKMVFAERSQLPESYKLIGIYQLSGNRVEVTVRVKKGNSEIQKFVITASSDEIEKLAREILRQVNMQLE
jgi:WD40 repeat protein